MTEYKPNQTWVRRKNAGGQWHLLDRTDDPSRPLPAKYMKCGAKIGGKITVFSHLDKRMSKNNSNTCPKCLATIEVSK